MPSPEHDKLTAMGARWFKKNGFPVVTTEIWAAGSRERPDVLGFRSMCSGVIEVKVSLSGGVSGNPRKFRHSALWNFLGGWSAA